MGSIPFGTVDYNAGPERLAYPKELLSQQLQTSKSLSESPNCARLGVAPVIHTFLKHFYLWRGLGQESKPLPANEEWMHYMLDNSIFR